MTTVKYGMEGYVVKLLQYALFRAGLDTGNLDGIFGRRTLRALQAFQRDQGIAADGMAGKLTWAALYPYITGYTIHCLGSEDMVTKALDMPVVTDLIPCSYALIGLMLKGLTVRYPFLTPYETGRSVMGRPMIAVMVGEGTRRIGCVGPHRADRWPLTVQMFRFLEGYATAYADGEPWARNIYGAATLHLLPLVNPDGMDLVSGALDPLDSFYAQARVLATHFPGVPFPEGWAANISGVDLSLQYPPGWAQARRTRFRQGFTRPGPRDYVGSEPLITPESRAVARWTRDRAFDMVLSCDPAYGAWFTAAWGRPGYVWGEEAGELGSVLFRAITLSP